MDEYIKRADALKIIDNYSKAVTEDGRVVVDAIRDIIAVITPTADVVPKSEDDEIVSAAAKFTLAEQEARYKALMAEHDREVAREIFEEIENALNLSKCYGDSGVYFEHNVETDIAELKKKYTEEKKDV